MRGEISVDQAYSDCLAKARRHYENFPVASNLLPKRLRLPVAVIYAFARTADDIADEGDADPEERLQALNDYARALDDCLDDGPADEPVFIALADVVKEHDLDRTLLHDLLRAFRMDVTKYRYANFAEVLNYCRFSANPVGRLLLQLDGHRDPGLMAQSDAICSALQLINFYQDLAQDYDENDRIYLPQDEMHAHGIDDEQIADRRSGPAMRKLMALQFERCRELMCSGAPLAWRLKGRLGLEIRLTVMGGLRVLDRLEGQTDLFSRPRLRSGDYVWMLWRALMPSPPRV
ncbi:MAG: squalene synthase HpnC [Gammaproteobacteria bacterium]|nr:squalene synthase HpnC [Gammaproteobacteria bacterium]